MDRPPIRQYFTQSLYPVSEPYLPRPELFDPSHDFYRVVIAGGGHISDMGFHDREQIALLLEPGVGRPRSPHQITPEHLEPDQIAGVIGHAHLVGLGIPDPETGADPAAFDRHALRPRIWMLDRARLGCIALPYTHFGVLMTRRIYHEDPEARTFLARVESCRPGPEGTVDVVLNRTAFYPTGGGQPHDSGVLAGFPVVDVFEREGTIVHRVRGGAVSGEVEGWVDWQRRLDHRQQHTGQHILSRAFLEVDEAMTVGFHLGEDTCTIDLDREPDAAAVAQAERLANDVVISDQPIVDTWYETISQVPDGLRKDPDMEGPIRILSIGTFDATPCGGTHCLRSGQVGSIKVLGTERRRGGLRIEFVCGYRALEDYGRRHRALSNTARLLSVEDLRVTERVQGLLDELKDQRARLEMAESVVRDAWVKQLASEAPGPLARVLTDARVEWLGPMAIALAERRNGPTLLVTAVDDEARAVMAVPPDSSLHAGHFLRELLVKAGGKGGGAERSGQGKLPAQAISNLIETWTDRMSSSLEKGQSS